ncbi:hypothetical protein MJG53_013549 [Ovis ammon polii x Ovis aries]|uniref:Protein-tyrosine sulfotransferase n=2 Tax=Ovis TaxID=9935 RepID=A0A836CVU6_SHEEP|nr:hypothetical protein JEQ12_005351 [Ovis aries]KAI4571443.1 hypothetical protein MJG53_013549 [Ovis ammon polii x Ovis aries]
MTDEVLDVAMQAFSLEVIAKHGKPDSWASTYSMVTCHITIASFNLGSYHDYLTKWSQAMELILDLLATIWSSTDLCDKDFISKPSTISQSKIE